MNGELIKRQDRWDLYAEDGSKIGSSAPNPMNKLSLKNCQAIANGYDLDELAEKRFGKSLHHASNRHSFREGFQKALEIIGDKKFSEEDLRKAIDLARTKNRGEYLKSENKIIQSLQQTEWGVDIETEDYVDNPLSHIKGEIPVFKRKYKLDENGCLILKRKV